MELPPEAETGSSGVCILWNLGVAGSQSRTWVRCSHSADCSINVLSLPLYQEEALKQGLLPI